MRLRWVAAIFVVLVFLSYLSPPFLNFLSAASTPFAKFSTALNDLPKIIVGSLFTALVAVFALRINASVNIRNKRMDVILHCNNRYDDLSKLRHEIDKEEGNNAKAHLIRSYFRRYWGLQSDQIDYWLAGYVDPETMTSWIISLADSLGSKSIGDGASRISYSESWNNEYIEFHKIVNARLADTVNFAQKYLCWINESELRYAAAMQYLRIVENSEGALIRHLSKDSYRRMKAGRERPR